MQKTVLKTTNGHFVSLEPTGNARQVLLTSKAIADIDWNGDVIKSLAYPGLEPIKVHGQVFLGKDPFKIADIEKHKAGVYMLSCVPALTKASQFLMPMLGHDKAYFLWNRSFINCYIDVEDIKYKFGGPHLYLVYRYSKNPFFTKFEKEIQEHEEFVRLFDIDKYHVMYVFTFPRFLEADYDAFRFGRYSLMREEVRHQILDFHRYREDSKINQILLKSESYRLELQETLGVVINKGDELYTPPKQPHETFWNKFKVTNSLNENVEFNEE